MVRRALWGIVIAELIAALALGWLFVTADKASGALLRNERSFASMVNTSSLGTCYAVQDGLSNRVFPSSRDSVKLALRLSEKFVLSLDSCMLFIDNALVWRANGDSVAASMQRAIALAQERLDEFHAIYGRGSDSRRSSIGAFVKWKKDGTSWIDNAGDLPPDLASLLIEKAREPILGLFLELLYGLNEQTDVTSLQFDAGPPSATPTVVGASRELTSDVACFNDLS